MSAPRCRLTIHLPHRELWLWRCAVLRALELPQTAEVPRVWEWYLGAEAAEVRDARRLTVVVDGEPDAIEDDIRHALWWAIAPCHRGLVYPTAETLADEVQARAVLRVEVDHIERFEEAQPAPLTRIPPTQEEAA